MKKTIHTKDISVAVYRMSRVEILIHVGSIEIKRVARPFGIA